MLVYIAGPMSKGRWEENTRAAIDAGAELMDNGINPLIPHIYCLLDFVHPQGYERWMALDFELIDACDALLRIPGESPGADREVVYAENTNVPVFTDISSLIEWSKK